MGDLAYMMLMPFLFFFLFFLAYLFRKRKVEKILFAELDESEKDLEARDFFYNILKMERSAKSFYYLEVIFLIINTFFILFGGYKTYLEEVEFIKEFPSFSISPLSSVLIKFMAPIIMWVLVFLVVSMSDIKLGDRYLFSVYPAYIIPYIYIQKIKVERFYRHHGGSIYYLDITLKRTFQNIKIYFAKEDVAEKVKEFILEKNKNLNEKENTKWDI